MAKKALVNGGKWFTPAEHSRAQAFLIETKGFQRNVPIPADAKYHAGETRDIYVADVTVFTTEAQLKGEAPPTELKSTQIDKKALVNIAESSAPDAGDYFVGQLGKNGQAWVWQPVDPAIETLVDAFYDKREGKVAETKAAGIPDFLKAGAK